MNNIILIPKYYNLDQYESICLFRGCVLGSYPNEITWLQLCYSKYGTKKDCDCKRDWTHHINFTDIPKEYQEDIYKKIELYLKEHPEKHIKYDGCCYTSVVK